MFLRNNQQNTPPNLFFPYTRFEHNSFQKQILLECAVKQGCSGDIDFLWKYRGFNIYIEMKHLGQAHKINKMISDQIKKYDCYEIKLSPDSPLGLDDNSDILRIQRDILDKSSIRKFCPNPDFRTINIIGIDVSELQLHTIDLADCLLAVGGNSAINRNYKNPEFYIRPDVVGLFENYQEDRLSSPQQQWIDGFGNIKHHPKEYIHGVMFLFRNPHTTANLSYRLSIMLFINEAIATEGSKVILKKFYDIFPPQKI